MLEFLVSAILFVIFAVLLLNVVGFIAMFVFGWNPFAFLFGMLSDVVFGSGSRNKGKKRNGGGFLDDLDFDD